MDRSVIDQYEQGGPKLRQSVAGMSARDLAATPVPGKWSTQQVVIHLADAEAAFADRVRRVLAQDEPTLLAWDENRFIANLRYEQQSVEDAVQIIELSRRQLARVLRAMPDEALARKGLHSERGPQTVADILGTAVWHLDHHLTFIAEKRDALRNK